jgi:DNA-binding CsgD family transcriptional regulator/Tfp pilus assembly protein PilF
MMATFGRSGRLVERLLERDRALAAIDRVLGRACGGVGCGVWFEGAPGVGKSSLVREATGRATQRGLAVLDARAIDHMQGFPYGLASSLLGDDLPTPAAHQCGVHAGGGQLPSADVGPAGELAVLHRLAGVVLDLSSAQPVLLAVDDAHWADLPSLRWLLYLTQRIDRLPVAIVAAARMYEPSVPGALLRQLAAQPAFTRVRVQPLSAAAVRSLVLSRLPTASAELCRAFQRLTDGNPFLLDRLVSSVALGGPPPDAVADGWIRTEAADAVVSDVLVRVGRLGPPAASVVDAVAILGDGAHVDEVADLCGSDVDRVLEAIEALAAVDVLSPVLPPSFAHPLLRAAVEHGMPAARGARLHRAAAALLDRRGVAVGRVAAHLLESVPAADKWVVARLRTAARLSLEGGAPPAAVDLLRRALDEPPAPADRVDVEVELAEAEIAAGEPAALERMRRALGTVDDDVARAELSHRYGWMLYRAGRFQDAFAVFDAGRQLPASDHDDVQVRLDMAHLAVGALTGRFDADAIDRRLAAETLPPNADAAAARRELLVQVAVAEVFAARDHERACRLAHQALGDGAMLGEDGLSFAYSVAVSVLFWCDALDEALDELARAVDHVGVRADLSLLGYVLFGRAQPRFWCGDVAGAAADAGAAVDLWAGGWHELLPAAHYWLAMALVELDDLVTAEASLPETDASDADTEPFGQAVRGRIALARGDVDTARDALRVCETLSEGLPILDSPATYPWRADAAIAAKLAGDDDDARRLAAEDLALASSFGAARPLGVALRTAALVADAEDRTGLLEQAVDVLDRSPAVLERCRTLVELGCDLRRRGRRTDARDPLYRGLDLARRNGLVGLERRAVDELRATGARPRRRDVTGPGALTPTERRVAELAANGHSNRQIAQLLFVTRKTVEWHLSHAYTKLGIDGRSQLSTALDAPGGTSP